MFYFILIMKLKFEQKKPGRIRQTVHPIDIEIDGSPSTVAELIDATVRSCVAIFNHKAFCAPERDNMDVDSTRTPISEKQIDDFAETGRVAFGIVYNGKMADPDIAAANALQSYADGLYRIFLNGNPLGELETKIKLTEGDCLTVVRLTLLAGRLW